MTTYTAHADALFDPDKPILGSTQLEQRDNLIAVTEGGTNAPPILVNALGVFTAGTTQRYYSASVGGTTSTSYQTFFNRSVGGSGTLRVNFDYNAPAGNVRMLVNGVVVASFPNTGGTVTSTSTDVTLTPGSVLKIQGISGGGFTTAVTELELLTSGEEIMFIADQEGVTFG